MATNKIIYSGDVLIDLTGDTVAAENLESGYTAHDKSGEVITGSLVKGTDVSDTTATASDVKSGKYFYTSSGIRTEGSLGDDNLFIAAYGKSSYADVLAAYKENKMVYCRCGTGTNPSTGNQLRMAFLAYVNNETTPTEFEFQYYRSVSTHSDSQQGDQVYVYKLNSSGTWSVTVRSAFTKIVAGTGLKSSYSNGTLTISLDS